MKKEKLICNRCSKTINPNSDWQEGLLGDPICELCIKRGILFGLPQEKKPKSSPQISARMKKKTKSVLPKSAIQKKNKWNDPAFMKQYWADRYANDPKRHNLCECGKPKQKNSEFCMSCHNKHLIYEEKKHIRDSSGRYIQIPA